MLMRGSWKSLASCRRGNLIVARHAGAAASSSLGNALGSYTDRFVDRMWMRGIP